MTSIIYNEGYIIGYSIFHKDWKIGGSYVIPPGKYVKNHFGEKIFCR